MIDPNDVLIEEFFIVESWKGIDVKKSLNQSRVYVKNAGGKFVEFGLLGHSSMCLSGLSGAPAEIGVALAEACSKKIGKPVRFVGAPTVDVKPEEAEEDE